MKLLTKSKYLVGLQCPNYLWYQFNEPEKIPKPDLTTSHKFQQGHLIGELAKKLYPNGIDIQTDDFMGNINQTKMLLLKKAPLFEPGFKINNVFCRPDILVPNGDAWDIIEVKSATKVKDINVDDVSFQKYCLEKCNLKINKCYLMHVNSDYVKNGDIEPDKLLVKEDITSRVNEIKWVEEKIKEMFEIISLEKPPEKCVGAHCKTPYKCPISDCWDFLPESNVTHLYRGGAKIYELLEGGVHNLSDIPFDFKLTGKQELQKKCEKEGKTYVNKEEIKKFLKKLEYPLYYLDFETFSCAIPMFDGLKPYQAVPFQYSLHVVDEGGNVKHHEFLYEGNSDPRKEFIDSLVSVLGKKGSIVVYNQSFEINVMKKLVDSFSEYKEFVYDNFIGRVVDLLVPFRNFYYYNPKQRGSASIKKVLPCLTGKGYDGMEISDGKSASVEFFNVTYGECSGEEKERVKENLEKYCCLDTEGMIWVVGGLEKLQ